MNELVFSVDFAGVIKTVRISLSNDLGQGCQVYIDSYYQGKVVKKDGRWIGHTNARSLLTADDIQAIGEIIDDNLTAK